MTILTAFYTANLTAYLTLSKIPIPYDNIKKIGFRDYWVVKQGDTMEQVLQLKPPRNNSEAGMYYYKVGYFETQKYRYYKR